MGEAFCRRIDTINEWVGRLSSLLFIPLVLIVTLEVVLRYFFNRPTIWAWDVNMMIAASLAIMGGGYTLRYRRHVIVDVVVGHLSPKAKARIDVVTFFLFFFSIGVLLWLAIVEAKISVVTGERHTSLLEPPIAPLRIVVAIGIFLLLIQGIAKFTRDLIVATKARKGDVS